MRSSRLFCWMSPWLLALSASAAGPKLSFEYTEEREPCTARDPLKKALFGETHAHTTYSADAYTANTSNPPSQAYAYAKGDPILITDVAGEDTRCAQLARPLDWAALTDHSEFLGPLYLCTTPGAPGYDSADCVAFRTNPGPTGDLWGEGLATEPPVAPGVCASQSCYQQSATYWGNIQQQTEAAYDRSAACKFTSFVGYEWTSMPGYNNRHRNVIFRNAKVPALPLSVYETSNDEVQLWTKLQSECIDKVPGCQVLTIPHNGNLSDGWLYTNPPGAGKDYATQRAHWEPLSEIHQGKGNSECRTGVNTSDPECGFEQLAFHNLDFVEFGPGEPASQTTADDKPFPPSAFLRNVLKMGLSWQQTHGANPYKFGFAGGTDTHSALPGGTDEGNFLGLHGSQTANAEGLLSQVMFNAGALTVAWAEENSRDAIFTALRNKETYATSGNRPTVRFFGGWDLPTDLCGKPDFVAQGYEKGVPMGSDLPARPATNPKPRFAVLAVKDPGSVPPSPLPAGNCAVYKPGAKLQRVELIKGWLDAYGGQREKVVTVAGSPALDPAATVDPASCNPVGPGHDSLCTVWTDEEFDPAQQAFYYLRVLENPTCRWSTYTCKSSGLDPFNTTSCLANLEAFSKVPPASGGPSPYEIFSICCSMVPGPVVQPTQIPKVEQQRAWTSPIWYTPPPPSTQSKKKAGKP